MEGSVSLIQSGTYIRPDNKKVDFAEMKQGEKQYQIECVSDGKTADDYCRLIETHGSLRIEYYISRGEDSLVVSNSGERLMVIEEPEYTEPTSRVCKDRSFTRYIKELYTADYQLRRCIEPYDIVEAAAVDRVIELMDQISLEVAKNIVLGFFNRMDEISENRVPQ